MCCLDSILTLIDGSKDEEPLLSILVEYIIKLGDHILMTQLIPKHFTLDLCTMITLSQRLSIAYKQVWILRKTN